jgi:stage V sporulation protein G
MEITEVRIKLMEDSDDRLQGFCSITFDNCFVVRDLKIIDGANGPFVAMPSRKLTSHCHQCGAKNHLKALYCNQCGTRLRDDRAVRDAEGRIKLYADIAHPINSQCREMIQSRVIAEFRAEQERAKQPGYVSRYDDDYDDDIDVGPYPPSAKEPRPAAAAPAESEQAKAAVVEPAQAVPPPPHIASSPPSPSRPHATPGETQASPPSQSAAPPRPSAPSTPPKKPNKGDFGAGIF